MHGFAVSFPVLWSKKTFLVLGFDACLLVNFGVWLLGGYTYSFEGLILCYTMAIPFFTNSILADLFFSGILYFGFKKIEKKYLIFQ